MEKANRQTKYGIGFIPFNFIRSEPFFVIWCILAENKVPDLYFLFRFKPLQPFYLFISNLFKKGVFSYPGIYRLRLDRIGEESSLPHSESSRSPKFRRHNALSCCSKKYVDILELRANFSKRDTPAEMNGLLTSAGIEKMLEEQAYRNMDLSFLPWLYLLTKLLDLLKILRWTWYIPNIQHYWALSSIESSSADLVLQEQSR